MSTLVIGYNVEWSGDAPVTKDFLTAVVARHAELDAPATLYVRSDVVERYERQLQPVIEDPRFDLQITIKEPLKTVCQEAEGETTVWQGAALDEIDKHVGAAVRVLHEATGTPPIGLSSPLGYYRGLKDRPDILSILDRHGIRFCRTYARDKSDWQPVPFSVAPFWYSFQGFPNILEFPSQGWQQAIIRKLYGWDERDGYTDYLREDIEEASDRDDLVWSYWTQDWSAIRGDPELVVCRELIRAARERGFEVVSQRQAYEAALSATGDE